MIRRPPRSTRTGHTLSLHERSSDLIVVNHVSFLDGALLAAFLPGRPVFAIDTHTATRWWVRPFLALVEAFPVNPTSPLATRALIRDVEKGKHCVIFPEGRITVTGALMKVYEGPGMIADKSAAPLLPETGRQAGRERVGKYG